MKKCRHYPKDRAFDFHLGVVGRKNKGNTKTTVQTMEASLKAAYLNYTHEFENDSLEVLSPIKVNKNQKGALQNLYSFSSKSFVDLREVLTVDEKGRKSLLCPNCTIETVGTFDHLLPQNEFPEFSDNPLNLIPCCSTCNSKKNSVWRKNGERVFLNLYIDDLPDVQYLFVTVKMQNDVPTVKYTIENRNNINSNLFKKIKNHYDKLELCRRFKEASDSVIGELEDLIEPLRDCLFEDNIKDVIIENARKEQQRYGFNYWKAIFKIACCENEDVFKFLTQTER